MAQIKLKNEVLNVDEEWMIKVRTQKNDPKVKASDMIEVTPGRHEMKSTIVGFGSGDGTRPNGLDVDDAAVRVRLRQFQHELAVIRETDPEKRGNEFGFWLVNNGYVRIDGKYNRIERVKMSNGKFYKKVSFSSVRKGYDLALELNVALGVLLKKERFARRMEHLGLLGGQECPDKPGTDKRCSICYPFSGRERMAEIRAEMGWPDVPVKVDLVDSMRMDKPVLATEPLLKKQSDDIPVVEEGAQSREEFEREAIENLTPEKTEPEEEFNFGEIRESELPF